mmetsp:Transcript_229/g.598  ORF Transcript_229/g.598 Transcript_229/m.598 type:complete len:187 (-) Transcript_229:26-586(-)
MARSMCRGAAARLALALLPLLGSAEVMRLSDATFEMETQASTGATTGSWFVTFGEADCKRCDVLRKEMALAEEELRDMYVLPAHMDASDGWETWYRFSIRETPASAFFARGRMWVYTGPESSAEIVSFCEMALADMKGGQKVSEEMNALDKMMFKVGARQAADALKLVVSEYFGLSKPSGSRGYEF